MSSGPWGNQVHKELGWDQGQPLMQGPFSLSSAFSSPSLHVFPFPSLPIPLFLPPLHIPPPFPPY